MPDSPVSSDQGRPHREFECPVDGCPVCMPPLGVVITVEEKAEFVRLRAENERLRTVLATDVCDDIVAVYRAGFDSERKHLAEAAIARIMALLDRENSPTLTKEAGDGR